MWVDKAQGVSLCRADARSPGDLLHLAAHRERADCSR